MGNKTLIIINIHKMDVHDHQSRVGSK